MNRRDEPRELVALGKLDKSVLEALENSPEALTLAQVAEKLNKPEKAVFKALKGLFEKGQIDTRGRRYSIVKE